MIRIVMAYDADRKSVGDIAARRAKAYAEKHGHEFVRLDHQNLIPESTHQTAYWLKVHALEHELMVGGCDWLLWLDSDAMIADMDFDIQTLLREDKSFICSLDYQGFCVGVFLLKNCEWSLNFMRTIKWLGRRARYGENNDQETFLRLVSGWDTVGSQTAEISETIVQNPATRTICPPFIFHYWTQWNNIDEIVKRMTMVEEQGWSEAARLLNSPEG